jgi:tRNA threonylcarbamoyladenosine biosynthesis protein TsaB
MNILIIDTSTERSLVALFQGDTGENIDFPFGYQSSKFLVSSIKDLLLKNSIEPGNLEFIGVTVGPGSFTGTRVGVATAQGLAFSLGIPVIGLNALAGFVIPHDGTFISLIDARIRGAYCMIQKKTGEHIEEISQPFLCSLEEIKDLIDKIPIVVSPNLQRIGLKGFERSPSSDRLLYCAKEKFINKEYDFGKRLSLLYFQSPSSC